MGDIEQGGDEVDEEGVEEDAGKKKVSILGRVILTPKDLKGIALLKRQKAAEKVFVCYALLVKADQLFCFIIPAGQQEKSGGWFNLGVQDVRNC